MPDQTSDGTREIADKPTEKLSADEIQDAAVPEVPVEEKPKKKVTRLTRRVRAIPTIITKSGDTATTVLIRKSDFRKNGVTHNDVTWDSRVDDYTVIVGNEKGQISHEAAMFLTKNYPTSFEFVRR